MPEFPDETADISYGLAGDLVTERCFIVATPGAANDENPPCGFVADVDFSLERGFYDIPIGVELSTVTPGATIRYTLDGSAPSQTEGASYSGPIPISTTATLRAIAFLPPLVPAPVVTHTYLFLDDVVRQNEDDLVPP